MESKKEIITDVLNVHPEDLSAILAQSLQKNACFDKPYTCGLWACGIGVFFSLGAGFGHATLRFFHKMAKNLGPENTLLGVPGGIIAKLESVLKFWFTDNQDTSFFGALKATKSDFENLLRDQKKRSARTLNSVVPPLPKDFKLVPVSTPRTIAGFGNYSVISKGYWTDKGLEIPGGVATVLPDNIQVRAIKGIGEKA